MTRSRPTRGFTLLEVLAAISVFGIVAMGLAAFAAQSLRRTSDNRGTTGAVLAGQQEIESLRALAYADVANRGYATTIAGRSYGVGTAVADDTPGAGMKQVTVTIGWTAPI